MDLRKDDLYRELMDCLDGLVKHYRQLLEVVRREKDILVAAKIADLNENNRSKDAMLVRIRSLENSRMKCARALAQLIGADVEAPRLLDLAVRLEGERSEKLRLMHATLELLIKRVGEVNKQNEGLVTAALNNITGAMDAIRDTLQSKPTYARQGALAPTAESGAGHLVSREA